ncbi:MAG: hypothetical protein ACYCPQ_10165 [Elusimicrobiota bacterium]
MRLMARSGRLLFKMGRILIDDLNSELRVKLKQSFGLLKVSHIQRSGRNIRIFLSFRGNTFWVELSAHDNNFPCFARTPSFNIRYSQMTVRDSMFIEPSLLMMVKHIESYDNGNLGNCFKSFKSGPQEETQKYGASPTGVEKILESLPSCSVPLARAFRHAVHDGMSRGDLKAESIEPSLALGEKSFRALVNVSSGSHGLAGFNRTACRFVNELGLGSSAFKKIVLKWLGAPDRDLYFGVNCGENFARGKAYFATARFGQGRITEQRTRRSFSALLSDIAAPVNLKRAACGRDRWELQALGMDINQGRIEFYKLYWHVGLKDAKRQLGNTNMLLPFLSKEGLNLNDLSPMTVCRRFNRAGFFIDSYVSVKIGRSGRSAKSLNEIVEKYSRAQGFNADAAWFGNIGSRQAPIYPWIISEFVGRKQAPHIYFLAAA